MVLAVQPGEGALQFRIHALIGGQFEVALEQPQRGDWRLREARSPNAVQMASASRRLRRAAHATGANCGLESAAGAAAVP